MRCDRCNRVVKQNPVYYKGKLYGSGCARKRGYKEPKRIGKAESTEHQLDLFNPFMAFEVWIIGLDW